MFIVRYRHAGTRRLLTLGTYGSVTLHQARELAKKELAQVADKKDPVQLRKDAKVKAKRDAVLETTLADAYKAFKNTRTLSPKTLKDYDRVMNETLKGWKEKPLTKITSDMVRVKHAKLPPAYGNLAMRVLRAVLNFAMEKYVLDDGKTYLVQRNPVAILSKTKAWKKVSARQNFLKPYQLKDWLDALADDPNETLRDYLAFVLFTGLRKENAGSLKWEQVDLKDRSIVVYPKMHDATTLPLPDHLVQMLRRREKAKTSDYVFPAEGKKGYVQEPRKALKRIQRKTGIKTTVHDLRRSYAQYAKSVGVPLEQVKQLLTHSTNDVTLTHYAQHNVETLRKPAQRIATYILNSAKKADNVVAFAK